MNFRIGEVLQRLEWMQSERIWPNGLRYLWTDAFGLVLYVSLCHELGDRRWLERAQWLVGEVERVLGRERGIRIGEAPDRDGQYYHYLAMWLYALGRLGSVLAEYRQRGIELVREIHSAFVIPGTGVIWKMREDLSGPYPGFGLGAMDAYDGYIAYRLLDETELAEEIAELRALIDAGYRELVITQDLGLGMMLWLTHFYPDEDWARLQRTRSLQVLEQLWINPPGYFCRQPGLPDLKFAFTNYGISIGLQAVDAWPERVEKLERFFAGYRSGDEYDREAITHVMACSSAFPGELLRTGWRA
ncbi:MAG: hypothetical protein D6727_08945 [Gammaproteobacteria bacterium]|nr:MAG: hypothetical protein D6727_08945 [Gammaproteobacteria bacterium]